MTFIACLPKFALYSIEEILDQLDDCRAKNDCLNYVLANNITNLAAMVGANSAAIADGLGDATNSITDLTAVVAVTSENIDDAIIPSIISRMISTLLVAELTLMK
jgi:hypothetical protein